MNPMNIYELGFALDEVTLFLDTHPDHPCPSQEGI